MLLTSENPEGQVVIANLTTHDPEKHWCSERCVIVRPTEHPYIDLAGDGGGDERGPVLLEPLDAASDPFRQMMHSLQRLTKVLKNGTLLRERWQGDWHSPNDLLVQIG